MFENTLGFVGGNWEKEIDVRDFIRKNYTPYDGDSAFLTGPSDRTKKIFEKFSALVAEATERAPTVMSPCLEEIEAADAEARRLVRELAKRREYAPRPRI